VGDRRKDYERIDNRLECRSANFRCDEFQNRRVIGASRVARGVADDRSQTNAILVEAIRRALTNAVRRD
jgi:hypothetical protein